MKLKNFFFAAVLVMMLEYIEVTGIFSPRGGISIYPFANYGDADHQDMVKLRMNAQLATTQTGQLHWA